MVQSPPKPRVSIGCKMRPPKREVGRGPACFALDSGPRSAGGDGWALFTLCNRGPRQTSGGRKRRLCPLIYGAKPPDAPRLEPFKDASSQAGGQTRPGVLRTCHRAKRQDLRFRQRPSRFSCLIPGFDGAILSSKWREVLGCRFYTGAPPRQRQSVERYSVVKRA